MSRPTFRRILLKISGESLTTPVENSSFHLQKLQETAQKLKDAHNLGIQIAVVCGGGNILRGHSIASSAGFHGIHRADADKIGMLATLMNNLALQSILSNLGMKTSLFSALPMAGTSHDFNRHDAIHALEQGDIILLAGGTGKPYFTTDSTAVIRALELECDYMVKATKVDGIYDCDPIENLNAKRYATLNYETAITEKLQIMDQTAFTLAQENNLKIAVLSLEHGFQGLLDGTGTFTLISNEL